MVHQAAVSRAQRADGHVGVAQPGQAGQVLVQVAVGWADDDGGAVHDMVTGEEERMLLDEPAQVVRRVARGVHCAQREAGGRARLAATQRPPFTHALVGLEPLGRAETDHRGPGGLGQGGGARRMVDVGVGHDDGPDRPQGGRRGHDGRGLRLVVRAGVDDDGAFPPHQVGVGARPGHEAGVGCGEPQQARRHLVDAARLGGGADAEVGHRRDHGSSGRGPGAASGPSSFAFMDTARTASLKSPRASPAPGSPTGGRS